MLLPTRRDAGGDMIETRLAFAQPQGEPTAEQWELIQGFFDSRIGGSASPSDVFVFDAIAASDGLDSYYTKHDVESGLERMAMDLRRGQSVLGNHDYGSFSYGSSFGGEVIQADPQRPEYEASSVAGINDPELITTKWMVGHYYIVRNVTANQQSTEDLIRLMQFGGSRKVSITFLVGRFICSIDDQDLLSGFDLLWDPTVTDEELEKACFHFPGVTYDGKLCWALMKDSSLFETSVVYKNASPSAMLLRKAEALASRGMFSPSDRLHVEERIGRRLPQPDRKLVVPGRAPREEESVSYPRRNEGDPAGGAEGDPAPTDGDPQPESLPAPDPAPEPTGDGEPGDEGGTGEQTTEEEAVEELTDATRAVAAMVGTLSTEQVEEVARAEQALEDALVAAEFERSVGGQVARSYEARNGAVTEALGGTALTAETARELRRFEQIGRTMFADLVRDTVAMRASVQGENFDSKAYQRMLEQSGDVAFVKSELESYRKQKAERFTPGRSVTPRPVEEQPKGRQAKGPEEPAHGATADDGQRILPGRSRA